MLYQGIGSSSNYYRSYIVRTTFELLISASFFIWFIARGSRPIFGQNEDNSPGSAIFGTKAVLCQISTFWYHCAGIPYQFYLVVYILVLILLSFYLVSCSYVFAWIMLPSLRSLSKTMKKFKQNSNHLKQEAKQNEIEGGLYGIYYSNKDTKLLLDLLAECSGIGPCLKLLCLL